MKYYLKSKPCLIVLLFLVCMLLICNNCQCVKIIAKVKVYIYIYIYFSSLLAEPYRSLLFDIKRRICDGNFTTDASQTIDSNILRLGNVVNLLIYYYYIIL